MGCASSSPPKPKPSYQSPPATAMHRNPPQPGTYNQYYEQARAAFTAGDTNRDGVLDAQELYGVLLRLGFFNGVPPQQVNQMMEAELQKADRHQVDRLITFEEFLPYFEYLMQELQRRGATVRPPAAPTQYYGQPGYGVNYGQPQYAQAPQPGYGHHHQQQQQQQHMGGGYGGHPQQQYGGAQYQQQYGGAQYQQQQQRRGGGGGMGYGGVAAAAVAGGVVGYVAGDAIVDGVSGGANYVADGVVGGANAVADWAPGAMDAAGGFAQDAGQWGAGAAGDIADWGGDAGGAIADWGGDAAGDIGDFAGDAIGAIGDFFG